MIHIKRSATPNCLLEDGISDGSLETERAKYHYTSGKSEDFDFVIYKNVKSELKEMFSGKCAYCESKIEHVQYMHIEHYRPKGYVEGETKKSPGYYWLGSKWENLLLACEICNGKEFKGNHFPLKDPKKRVKNHLGNIHQEEPLLINPCEEEHPEDHIIFKGDGEIEGVSLIGKQSIKHYGLFREDLRKARARYIYDLDLLLIALTGLIESYDNSKSTKAEEGIRKILEKFQLNKDNDAQFAGLSRQYLHEKVYDLL
ncbi:hypothetical protein COL99_24350 [Bacillus toyonensis]|uniref:hypothetical protein n=1 Tax=Bacillus toyonensis TaxID=155322 RepID=UPI000BF36F76|nr:hypothetical protein [Bacillus toyonensis]PGC09926.1 hypothetical protein COL99_24350 [Bacillus toyonensis]PGC78826.1 hypothetical protein COM28_19420 [Bacillus toyonensis]